MAFRADEAAKEAYDEVEKYLILRPRDSTEEERRRSLQKLRELADELGPAVSGYPMWHPLVRNHDSRDAVTTPSERCGYAGLDHTRYFAHGFITCPYGDGQKVLDSVAKLPPHHAASISAEILDVEFYNASARPIVVRCDWHVPLEWNKMIPLKIAMPLLLESELPAWEWAQCAETWESMRSYFLGSPHGARSSLFVSQETGQAMKKIWEALIQTGMYGPIKV